MKIINFNFYNHLLNKWPIIIQFEIFILKLFLNDSNGEGLVEKIKEATEQRNG